MIHMSYVHACHVCVYISCKQITLKMGDAPYTYTYLSEHMENQKKCTVLYIYINMSCVPRYSLGY